jgi:hypothetical protein
MRKRRFYIEDGRAVQRFEMANLYAHAVDRDYLRIMQPDRVGAIGRTRAEDAGQWSRNVTPRMDRLDVPPCSIEPRQNDDSVANSKRLKSVAY